MNDAQAVEALQQAKRDWFKDAKTSGVLNSIATICRTMGTSLNAKYGPKYELVIGDVRVYVDDYGNYMTVRDQKSKEELCSTHRCDELFRPGPWVDPILELGPAADALIAKQASEKLRTERDALAKRLGMAVLW